MQGSLLLNEFYYVAYIISLYDYNQKITNLIIHNQNIVYITNFMIQINYTYTI